MTSSGIDGSLVSDAVREAARRGEPDRYLAALLAPRALRGDLAALAAFAAELDRIVQIVSEPMAGEIRLQWWRDALEAMARGESVGHPLADALGGAVQRYHLPMTLFQAQIDARSVELGVDPIAAGDALGAYLEATEGSVFRLALRVLGMPDGPQLDALVRAAARAYGIARRPGRLLLTLHAPDLTAPAEMWDALARLRDQARLSLAAVRSQMEPRQLPAFLPLVMVEPYLGDQEHVSDPLRDAPDVAPLARVSRIWWAHMRGRI